MDPLARIAQHFNDSLQAKQQSLEAVGPGIVHATEAITRALLGEHKVLSCGNGGSGAHAQHFTALMLNRFDRARPGLPSIALNADGCTLTSIANDDQYADIFAKPIRALGQPGDILLLLTTRGNASTILAAADAAHDRDMSVVALTGRDGGLLSERLIGQDVEIRVPVQLTARIHEVHILIIHCLCDLIDQNLLGQEN
ncbi:MAG: SIS domain-containing protein [Gammaproteobacteria bacterium]